VISEVKIDAPITLALVNVQTNFVLPLIVFELVQKSQTDRRAGKTRNAAY